MRTRISLAIATVTILAGGGAAAAECNGGGHQHAEHQHAEHSTPTTAAPVLDCDGDYDNTPCPTTTAAPTTTVAHVTTTAAPTTTAAAAPSTAAPLPSATTIVVTSTTALPYPLPELVIERPQPIPTVPAVLDSTSDETGETSIADETVADETSGMTVELPATL